MSRRGLFAYFEYDHVHECQWPHIENIMRKINFPLLFILSKINKKYVKAIKNN